VASNPEFLREGSAVADSLYPDRIVVGASDAERCARCAKLYEPLVTQSYRSAARPPRPGGVTAAPLQRNSLTSGKMIKYAANAFWR